MKSIKLLLITIAFVVGGIKASAQYWGEYNTSWYTYAGYSAFNYKLSYDKWINGVNVGVGHIRQVGFGHVYWDFEAAFTYGFKNGGVNDTKTTSVKIAFDLLRQFELADKVYLFPYVGIAVRYHTSGKTTTPNNIYEWFGDRNLGLKRFQFGLQTGFRVFIRRFYLGAEFQQYLTEMLPGAHTRINMFGASAGMRF